MSKSLFEVTEDRLDTGLRGYPVGYCVTSHVDPQTGLHYCGIPIRDIALKQPQEVLYLLYSGEEGGKGEVEKFFKELTDRSILSSEIVEKIHQLPKKGHPMKLFSASLLLLEMIESSGDYREDCINIIAKLPHLVACIINHHAGRGETSLPDFSHVYMGALTAMLNVPNKQPMLEEVFLQKRLVLNIRVPIPLWTISRTKYFMLPSALVWEFFLIMMLSLVR